mmetsp:Transcript_13662/g.34025  ORF Transcript_13662/g.34025 Transcript_13662/m.34025 type:complete len:230 (+) Transcript_13662:517-1206(+)
MLEHPDALAVARAPVAHAALQPLHRLDVVRVHVQPGGRHRGHAGEARGVVEVGREALEAHRRLELLHAAHDARVMLRPAVGEVVAVDRGDHHVVHAPRGDRLRRLLGLVVRGQRRFARRLDVAEAAGARARVAEDHDRGRGRALLARPALADVRAARLLAHRRQLARTQVVAYAHVVLAARPLHAEPVGVPHVRLLHPLTLTLHRLRHRHRVHPGRLLLLSQVLQQLLS